MVSRPIITERLLHKRRGKKLYTRTNETGEDRCQKTEGSESERTNYMLGRGF